MKVCLKIVYPTKCSPTAHEISENISTIAEIGDSTLQKRILRSNSADELFPEKADTSMHLWQSADKLSSKSKLNSFSMYEI